MDFSIVLSEYKIMKLLTIYALTLFIFACTPNIYGVSKNNWETLSPSERKQAIEHYQKMEELREQRRIENAKVDLEKEKYRQQQLEARQHHAKKVYAGQAGVRGDLLRITIFGGQIEMNGKHRHYSPVSLKIVDGEQKTVIFHHPEKRRYQTEIQISYIGGLLTFDESQGREGNYSHPIAYEPKWRKGARYNNINLNKRSHSHAKNISIIIDAIALPKRHYD